MSGRAVIVDTKVVVAGLLTGSHSAGPRDLTPGVREERLMLMRLAWLPSETFDAAG